MKAGTGRVIVTNVEKNVPKSDFATKEATLFKKATVVSAGDTPNSSTNGMTNEWLNDSEILILSTVQPQLLPIKGKNNEDLFLIKLTNIEVILDKV